MGDSLSHLDDLLRLLYGNKKEKRKNQSQCSSSKSSYLQEKLLEILFNLFSQLFGTRYEI